MRPSFNWLTLYTTPRFLPLVNERSPALTVDGIILKDHAVLLIQRKNKPFQGAWALPGGFVEYGETTEHAVIREILEETGLHVRIVQLVGVYSDPHRDPRGHTVTVAYLVEPIQGILKAGDDACTAKYFNKDELPELSFDHARIIQDAFQRV
jgi:8-oxo-dGTP diphosphatase